MTNFATFAPAFFLAPLGPEHAAAMLRWMQDPEVAENLGLRNLPTWEKTIAWIAQANAADDCVPLAIMPDGKHVGNVILDRIDRYLGTVRLSIYIGDASDRGRGVGRAAVKAAVNYAFETLELHKVWLTVHQHNARAIAAYEAAGFAREGVLRDEFLLRGARCHAVVMGILRIEFIARAA